MGGLVIGFLTNQENTNPIGGEGKHQATKARWRIQIIRETLVDTTG
jgi:hypothetical protein